MMTALTSRWARHKPRTALIIMAMGIFIELLVAVSAVIIRQLFWGEGAIYTNGHVYRGLLITNSLVGAFGATLLSYGVLSYIRGYRISKVAEVWVYIALTFFITYKAFDVLQTIHWQVFRYYLGIHFDLDIMISNLLLVISALTVLVGMMRALKDANQSSLKLEAQNMVLDREIQERHKSESQARTSEERLAAILNALSAPIFLSTQEGYVLAHNEVFARMYGHGENVLIGKHLLELLPESVVEAGKRSAGRAFRDREAQNFILHHDQRCWDINIYPVPTTNGAIPTVTVLANDITEKLRNEQERRLLETAINNAAECIVVTDAQGSVEYVNPAFEEQTGYSRQEIMGRTPALLKSGKQEISFYRELWNTIKQGKVWRGRFINRRKDGELFHENATISPIISEDGVISHYVAVKRNVTREHQLEQQLQQAQKIEALGTLAGGIAHDLNNVLAIILGRSELMLEVIGENEAARESLDTIMRTATRSSKLIKRLLAFTRQGAGEAGPLTVAPLIKEQLKTVRAFLPSNVQLVEQIELDKEIIIADPSDIQQIAVNLLNNANHAMQPAGGTIETTLKAARISYETATTTGPLKPGDYICLSVRDTGSGMDDDVKRRIFDPFFTTKDVGEGSGLGLPMVHGSVLGAGGQINVQTAPGVGTQFDIFWPLAQTEDLKAPDAEEQVSGHGITVLLLDDLKDFTELLTMNLENHGYTVAAFSEAPAALNFFQNHADEVNIAVVDYMMPKMNGKQLGEALHQKRPDLPIVLLSGYASGITNENAQEHGFCAMFEKPLEIDFLSRRLARLARR